ncbi:MAG: carbohydrate porin [Planctomycetota bacterium]
MATGTPLCACETSCAGKYLSRKQAFAESGILFVGNLTQFYFGTASGGIEQEDRFGGHGDYLTRIDFGKLGLQPGLFLQLRAEHRYGQSVTEVTGAILPPTLAPDLPVTDSNDLYLTNFLFQQFLSESFGIYAGKLDTLDGDQNAYASGRGITQFSNTALIANPVALRTVPYASLGCGFVWMKEGEPLFNFLVINPTDTADSDGFDELFAEGVSVSAEGRVATKLGRLPGHQLLGVTWSSREFVSLGQDPRIVLPNIPIDRQSGSWSVYWNTDQALWQDPCDRTRHWGYFARAGVADDATNPLSYFLSGGFGGAVPGTAADTFGIGYFRNGTSDEIGPFLQTALGPIGDGQGLEIFYRHAFNAAFSISPDLQWLSPARENVDDALVLGVRANVMF